jgi:cytochrome c oxidase cbb3-type subunit 3
MKQTKWVLAFMLLLFATGANAQGAGGNTTLIIAMVIMALVAIVVLLVAVFALQVLRKVVRLEGERRAKEAGIELPAVESFWQKFLKVANRRVEPEKEKDIILDHDYDGIKELDNHLPPWWTYLFYLTIIFGVFYVIAYHVTDSLPLQEEEYEIEMAEAAVLAQQRMAASQASGDAFNEAELELSTDPDILASGGKIFTQQCAVCHKADGGGSIGPNLTDNYWIHGGDIKSVYTVIKEGVVEKGMISWKAMLSPTQMRDVANYVKSLGGTNPPDAKAPQGELVEE